MLEKYQSDLDKDVLSTAQNLYSSYDELTNSELKLRKEVNSFISYFEPESARHLMPYYQYYKKMVSDKIK